jgi:hypothetical protein
VGRLTNRVGAEAQPFQDVGEFGVRVGPFVRPRLERRIDSQPASAQAAWNLMLSCNSSSPMPQQMLIAGRSRTLLLPTSQIRSSGPPLMSRSPNSRSNMSGSSGRGRATGKPGHIERARQAGGRREPLGLAQCPLQGAVSAHGQPGDEGILARVADESDPYPVLGTQSVHINSARGHKPAGEAAPNRRLRRTGLRRPGGVVGAG